MKSESSTLFSRPRGSISGLIRLALACGLSLMVNASAGAAGCNYIPKGGAKIWTYDFTRTLSGAQNEAGRLDGPIDQTGSGRIMLAGCTCNDKGDWAGYYQATSPQVTDGQGFQRINEYLSVKTEIFLAGGIEGFATVPFLEEYPKPYPCDYPSDRGGGKIKATFRIDRPFVGMTPIPLMTLANFYASMWYKPDLAGPVESIIKVSGNVTVPQSCTINAGQIVTVEFNQLPSTAFRQSGEKAVGVNPVSRTLGIKCSNIDAQAQLSMRVEADKTAGNAIVSDNPDVGFELTDSDNQVLTPNTLTSVIPFKLDEKASAQVGIKVFPVSITGKLPEPGPVMARGYLRIDFD